MRPGSHRRKVRSLGRVGLINSAECVRNAGFFAELISPAAGLIGRAAGLIGLAAGLIGLAAVRTSLAAVLIDRAGVLSSPAGDGLAHAPASAGNPCTNSTS